MSGASTCGRVSSICRRIDMHIFRV
jgi:hypothetical protein